MFCFCILCGNGKDVYTAADLIDTFNDATTSGIVSIEIEVCDDLDFSHVSLASPLGFQSPSSCIPFSGTLHGNGHSIKGLVMESTGVENSLDSGLFCRLKNATIENLVIEQSCRFSGYNAGALSVRVVGSLSVVNVTNQASVSGNWCSGGFVGMIENVQNDDHVEFDGCVNEGEINGYNNVGGIVGLMTGNSGINLHFDGLVNRGCVNCVENSVGGFLGQVYSCTDVWITISNCTNHGTVKGTPFEAQTEAKFNDLGGFVGYIYDSHYISLAISNSLNNGTVIGDDNCVGGFIGSLDRNSDVNVSFLECVNDGSITGNDNIGGFVGIIHGNDKIDVTIFRCINSGHAIESGSFCAGFVGCIYGNINFVMNLSSSTNNGSIIAKKTFAGGFIGLIFSPDESHFMFFDDSNKGGVSAETELACGFFCVSSIEDTGADITVFNSINKGNINAPANAYGIANFLKSADHVVSMGDVIASSNPHTFWGQVSYSSSFFALKDKCVGCDGHETSFVFNEDIRMYDIVVENSHLHDVLNQEAKTNDRCHKLWTSELELVDKLYVQVIGLFDERIIIESGMPLKRVGNLSKYFVDEQYGFLSADSETSILYDSEYIITSDLTIILGVLVNVSVVPINKQEKLLIGETLEQVANLFGFSMEAFFVRVDNTNMVLNKSSIIEADVVLVLCHNVTVSGVLNDSWLIPHDTKLSEINKLSQFFVSSFIIYNATNPSHVFNGSTAVTKDIHCAIVNVSKQEIIIEFDDGNITVEDVEETITDLVVIPSCEHLWVDVLPWGDGFFYVLVRCSNGETIDIIGSLRDCIHFNS